MSDEKETEASVKETPSVPIEVKVTNSKIDKKWNDSTDDIEYDEIEISKEDMDI